MSDCHEKFLSMWDTHSLVAGSPRRRGRRRYLFMIYG